MLLILNVSEVGDQTVMFWQMLITEDIFIKPSENGEKVRILFNINVQLYVYITEQV